MFHDTRFPTSISLGATGGPERRTEVVTLGSGFEERNTRWADSRRVYNAGYGVKSLDDLYAVIAFFEERRGRLHGFRWKDFADFRSSAPSSTVTAADQTLATGDGVTASFQLRKVYGSAFNPYVRDIKKPVAGSVLAAVDGAVRIAGTHFSVESSTGIITFLPPHIPPMSAAITAGFEFDVPVRFDTDRLEISLDGFRHGSIPAIPVVEIRI